MQTTIQLDDVILAQAKKLAEEKGCDLSRLIEEALRDKMTPTVSMSSRQFSHLTTVGGTGTLHGLQTILIIKKFRAYAGGCHSLKKGSILFVQA